LNKNVFINNPLSDHSKTSTEYFIDYLHPNATFVVNEYLKNFYEINKNNSTSVDVIDMIPSQLTLINNEPAFVCEDSCKAILKTKGIESIDKYSSLTFPISFSDLPLEVDTLPLITKLYNENSNINTNSMLNYHNLYSIMELKVFTQNMKDLGVKRPLIFSKSGYLGSQQYAAKIIGGFSGWIGLQTAILKTMQFNVNYC
jgi:hypothetical protein